MLKDKWPIIMMVLLVVALAAMRLLAPKEIDWKPDYTRKAKIPYGNFLLFELLPEIFPEQSIDLSFPSVYDKLNEEDLITPSNYILINNILVSSSQSKGISSYGAEALLNYVQEGNHAFVSATALPDTLEDTLNINIYRTLIQFLEISNKEEADSIQITFHDESIEDTFYLKEKDFTYYFGMIDTNNAEILASVDTCPVLIRQAFGKGSFVIASDPVLFTNYNLVNSNLNKFASTALSYLPVQHTYWDTYHKAGRLLSSSPLRFVLSQRALRWAYFVSMISLLFYIIFKGKRLQRVIPEIKPLRNLSLDFTKTIAKLYYLKRNNKDIAKKKTTYFNEYLRSQHFISSGLSTDELKQKLLSKSGLDEKSIEELMRYMANSNNDQYFTDSMLFNYNMLIENFRKASKI